MPASFESATLQPSAGWQPRELRAQYQEREHAMANIFEKEFGIPLPKCCNTGDCCKGASPSVPYHQLLAKAVAGEDFARGFFSIMVPYASHAEAERVVPGLVQRTIRASEKLEDFKSPEDIVFYRCRYQTADDKCGIWEDRPQFCRDYPDTPFVVMAPGCAFEPWAAACKDKYTAMKAEVAKLKELKAELAELYAQQAEQNVVSVELADNPEPGQARQHDFTGLASANPETRQMIQEVISSEQPLHTLSMVLSLTALYLGSPLRSALIR
ncbi:MAG TPA: YkgJ family cysteine cluster protein [Coleofasciculaceae cyanobacterium]